MAFGNGTAGDGTGTTIAIVDAYDDPNIANDLHQFDLAFGLPDPVLTKVNQTGGTAMPVANGDWITEIALDVEWAHAIAPKANILLVEADNNSDSNLFAAVDFARRADNVVAVSMSWDSGEYPSESTFDSDFTTVPGHAGVSFVAASGDLGAPAGYPSASPNVLSVGGTSLNLTQGNYSSESGWSGSGGGLSAYEPQPGYQKGVVIQSTSQRTNPDVAYDSDPNTGFPVYDSYNNGIVTPWGQWGGTSDAAPQWAALIAIADQGRAIAGKGSLDGSTQLLPDLYQLPSSDFHDVSTGSSAGIPSYSASAGYDLVTGRGTPIANLIVADLIKLPGSSLASHFSISVPPSIVPGNAFSITLSALNAANSVCTTYAGTVEFTSTDAATGVVLPMVYTFNSSDAGVHVFTGLTLVTPGTQSLSASDSMSDTIVGSASLWVINVNSVPVLSGSGALTYVKNQSPTAISPNLTLTDSGHITLPSATVAISNVSSIGDVLAFVNDDETQYGNITGIYSSATGRLTLTSSGTTASVSQFQAALRAVTYFNLNGNQAVMGTRSVAFQVFNDTKMSNVVTSLITITNPGTTCVVTSLTPRVVFGQQVTLTATIDAVWPGVGTPTAEGSSAKVTFLYDGQVLAGTVGYSVLNGKLIATLSTSSLPTGIHAITAKYSGDQNFLGSTSVAVQQTVFHAGTTTTVSSSAASAAVGQAVTLTATIGVVSPGTGIPTAGIGTAKVVFMDGATNIAGTVTYSVLNGKLVATLTTSSLSLGVHTMIANYLRDTGFLDSTSAAIRQTIVNSVQQRFSKSVTTCLVSSSNASPVFGQSITLTATIGALAAGKGTPTAGQGAATVKFMEGTNVLSGTMSYSVVNKKLIATLTTSVLAAGIHHLTAVYFGDSNFLGSTSTPFKQTVFHAGTMASISASTVSARFEQPVTFTAVVSVVEPGTGIPTAGTGTAQVTFRDGNVLIAGTVVYRVENGKLIAALTTSALAKGTHAITAIYSHDASFLDSTSVPLKLVVG